MSEYNWNCPSCGKLMLWYEDGHYVESIDDNCCRSCHEELTVRSMHQIFRNLAASRLSSARDYLNMAKKFGDDDGFYASLVMSNMKRYFKLKMESERWSN